MRQYAIMQLSSVKVHWEPIIITQSCTVSQSESETLGHVTFQRRGAKVLENYTAQRNKENTSFP